MPPPKIKDITPEQAETAARLREAGSSNWRAIAKAMGVSEYALVKHFDPRKYERRRAQQREWGERLKEGRRSDHSVVPPGKPLQIPEHVLREREISAELGHTSITAAQMGDPLPGRSALDRKVAGTFRQIGDIAAQVVRRLA